MTKKQEHEIIEVSQKVKQSLRQYAIYAAYEALMLTSRELMETRGVLHVLGVSAEELDAAIEADRAVKAARV